VPTKFIPSDRVSLFCRADTIMRKSARLCSRAAWCRSPLRKACSVRHCVGKHRCSAQPGGRCDDKYKRARRTERPVVYVITYVLNDVCRSYVGLPRRQNPKIYHRKFISVVPLPVSRDTVLATRTASWAKCTRGPPLDLLTRANEELRNHGMVYHRVISRAGSSPQRLLAPPDIK